ncbi:unnamed protein product, partial [Adineta steineri]|jgi:DNA-binding XRE family transcriptional regulator/mRNA-degrading endonuclease RelE of RelBE toxin-antitoxin system
MISIG